MTISSAPAALVQHADPDTRKRHSSSKFKGESGEAGDVVTRAELLIRQLALAKNGGGEKTSSIKTPKKRSKEEGSKQDDLLSSALTPQQSPLTNRKTSCKRGGVMPPTNPYNTTPDLTAATVVEDLDESDCTARSLLSGGLLDSPDSSLYSKSSTKDLETKLLDEARTRALAAEQDGALEEAGLQADLAEVNAKKMERAMATWTHEDEEDDVHSSKHTATTEASPTDDLSSVGSGSAFSYGGLNQSAAEVRSLAEFLRKEGGGAADAAEALRSLVEGIAVDEDDVLLPPPPPTLDAAELLQAPQGDGVCEDWIRSVNDGLQMQTDEWNRQTQHQVTNTSDDAKTLYSITSASAREERSAVDAAEEQARKMAEEVSWAKDAASAASEWGASQDEEKQKRESQGEVSVMKRTKAEEDRRRSSSKPKRGTDDVWHPHWSKEHNREYYYNATTEEVRWDRPTNVQDAKPLLPPIHGDGGGEEDEDDYSVPVSDYTNSPSRNKQQVPRCPASMQRKLAVTKTQCADNHNVPVSDYTKSNTSRDMILPDIKGESNRRALYQSKRRKKRRVVRIAVALLIVASLSVVGYLVFIRKQVGRELEENGSAAAVGATSRNQKEVRSSAKKNEKQKDGALPSPTVDAAEKKKKKKRKKKKVNKKKDDAKVKSIGEDPAGTGSLVREENVIHNVLSKAGYGRVPVFFFGGEEDKCMHTDENTCINDNTIEPKPIEAASGSLDKAEVKQYGTSENSTYHLESGEAITTAVVLRAEEEKLSVVSAIFETHSWKRILCRYVPLAHIVWTECHHFVTRHPLFDLQSLSDSMMQ